MIAASRPKLLPFKLAFFVSVALLFTFSFMLLQKISRQEASAARLKHFNLVKSHLEEAIDNLSEAESSQRAYFITGDSVFLSLRSNSITIMRAHLHQLDSLVVDNQRQNRQVQTVATLVNRRIERLDKGLRLFNEKQAIDEELKTTVSRGIISLNSIQRYAKNILKEEAWLLEAQQKIEDRSSLVTPIDVSLLIVFSLAVLIVSALVIGNQLRHAKRYYIQSVAANKELKETNELFEHAEDVAGQGSWQWNLATEKLTYSNNQYRLFGFEPGGFEPTFERFLRFIHPEDLPAVKDDHRKHLETGMFPPLYFRIIRKDGEVRHMKGMAKVTSNEKGETFLFGTNQDITSETLLRQQLQERTCFAEAVLENSANMIMALDTNMRYTLWNKVGEELTGISKEQILGKRMAEMLSPAEYEERFRFVERGLKGEIVCGVELPFSKGKRVGEFSFVPIKDAKGKVTHLVVICNDMTERMRSAANLRQLNESLKEKNLELEQTNKELASFNFIASHDLQEPLRKIQTFSSLLLEDETAVSGNGKKFLNRMQQAASGMRTILNDLLTFSQTDVHHKEFTSVDLNVVLQEVKTFLKDVIDKNEVVINAARLPMVKGAKSQLRQLFECLIGNAIKFSGTETAPHITITSSVVKGDANETLQPGQLYWRLCFKDNGIGFEQEYAASIFELFHRLHSKSDYPGSGIGLAICKKIVQNHGGLIFASSQPDKGAIFEIYLPTAKVLQPLINQV